VIKLLSNNLKDDIHRTNIGMLYEKVLEVFSRIKIRKPIGSSIVMEKDWEDLDYQMTYWSHAVTTWPDNFEIKVDDIKVEDIQQVLKIANDFYIPWVSSLISKDT